MKKIEKNKTSEELIDLASQPDFLYGIDLVEFTMSIENPEGFKELSKKEGYSKREKDKLLLVGRLLLRDLVIRRDRGVQVNGQKSIYRYFELTDYGYRSLIDYRMNFKFWLPLILSLTSIFLTMYEKIF